MESRSSLMNAIGTAKSVKLGLASVPESTSSWFKTVMDPAHAREYGTNGVPDEAHCPSLILQDRDTIVVTPNTFATWRDASGVNYSASSVTSIDEVWMVQSQIAAYSLVLVAKGSFVPTGTDRAVSGYSIGYITNTRPSANASLARCVAFSSTVEYVGKELDRGGYFEAAHLPQGSGAGSTALEATVDFDTASNYVSYTAHAQQGVYIVCRMNNMDVARMWGNPRTLKANFRWQGYTFSNDVSTYWPQPGSGWMANAVHYVTTNVDDWVLRVTVCRCWEVARSPAEGGRDGVVLDRQAMDAYLHVTDAFDPIYPASYNDLQKVLGKVSKFMTENDQLISGLASLVPYGQTVHGALKVLSGSAAPAARPTPATLPVSKTKPSKSKKNKKAKASSGKRG